VPGDRARMARELRTRIGTRLQREAESKVGEHATPDAGTASAGGE